MEMVKSGGETQMIVGNQIQLVVAHRLKWLPKSVKTSRILEDSSGTIPQNKPAPSRLQRAIPVLLLISRSLISSLPPFFQSDPLSKTYCMQKSQSIRLNKFIVRKMWDSLAATKSIELLHR
jgi:hypothetical protein